MKDLVYRSYFYNIYQNEVKQEADLMWLMLPPPPGTVLHGPTGRVLHGPPWTVLCAPWDSTVYTHPGTVLHAPLEEYRIFWR
jgi:hypothetical protein